MSNTDIFELGALRSRWSESPQSTHGQPIKAGTSQPEARSFEDPLQVARRLLGCVTAAIQARTFVSPAAVDTALKQVQRAIAKGDIPGAIAAVVQLEDLLTAVTAVAGRSRSRATANPEVGSV